MIEFVSLFLGLVVGVHPVEVAPGATAARVEVLLDGAEIGRLTAPPWRLDCDFGTALAPHELIAVAFDSRGAEIGRARQWVNLPRPRAETRLVVDAEGRTARLVAASLPRHPLESVAVTLDGEPLAVDDAGNVTLPRYDRRRLHILSAELAFAGNLHSRVDLAVGGDYGEAVSREMTAVPLLAERAPKRVSAERLSGVLRKAGRPLAVVAAETGRSEIVVVVEPGALLQLGELGLRLDRETSEATRRRPERGTDLAGSRDERLRPGEKARFVSTVGAEQTGGAVSFDLFSISQPFTAAAGDLPFLVTHVAPEAEQGGAARTADAVAAGAVQAAAGNRPRALVLVLGPDGGADASRFPLPEARRFLARLRVPLVVWRAGRVPAGLPGDQLPPIADTPWGKAANLTSLGRLRTAVQDLRTLLDRQLVVWVDGAHLPQEIELAADARGLALPH